MTAKPALDSTTGGHSPTTSATSQADILRLTIITGESHPITSRDRSNGGETQRHPPCPSDSEPSGHARPLCGHLLGEALSARWWLAGPIRHTVGRRGRNGLQRSDTTKGFRLPQGRIVSRIHHESRGHDPRVLPRLARTGLSTAGSEIPVPPVLDVLRAHALRAAAAGVACCARSPLR